jgi:hypothetical protein
VCLAAIVFEGSFNYVGRELAAWQGLPAMRDRFSDYLAPAQGSLISDHVGWPQCGNSDYTSPVYTQLYTTRLPRAEFEGRFSPTASIRLHFIEASNIRESPKSSPCFYYLHFEGHNIPVKIEPGATVFIAFGFANEVLEQFEH